jgi:transglutaminase-like putative cysteine protease
MDLLTFLAIFITGEVAYWPFIVALSFNAIRLLTQFRFRTLWMVAGFLLQLFLGFQLVLRLQLHPLVAAAHIAPIAMGWIGLTRGGENFWGWRMGLGFIGLIVASALSPDFSVMLLILAFIIAGSVALACRFLVSEFVLRGITGSLPPGFIRSGFYQSGILLLSALLIFPLIPRVQGRSGGTFGQDHSKTGYTEEVNLNEWTRVSGQGSSAPALRIYGPNGTDPTLLIPAGLLRSRVLNILDGTNWGPGPLRIDTNRTYSERDPSTTLMIVKEMTGPANLPVPYTTRDVMVELYGYRWSAERTKSLEWREPRSRNQRFNYHVSTDPRGVRAPQDTPSQLELVVPKEYQSDRIKRLAKRLFEGKKTAQSKISAIQALFINEQFEAASAESDEARGKTTENGKELPPIERFLFAERSGHCELFASSMAILLRLGGVPTRLIAGFRVSRNAIGDVLTVRQSDAHAWLEAYVPGHGWTAVDPTPKIISDLALSDWIRDTYDWASAKWTQYILNYGEGSNSLRAQWEKIKKIGSDIAKGENPLKGEDSDTNFYLFGVIFLVGSTLLSAGAIALFRRLRRKKTGFTGGRFIRDLQSERAKMERMKSRLASKNVSLDQEIERQLEEWFREYEAARFGLRSGLKKETVHTIRKRRTEIENAVRRSV